MESGPFEIGTMRIVDRSGSRCCRSLIMTVAACSRRKLVALLLPADRLAMPSVAPRVHSSLPCHGRLCCRCCPPLIVVLLCPAAIGDEGENRRCCCRPPLHTTAVRAAAIEDGFSDLGFLIFVKW
ncbi:hypothetical protein ACLOJK_019346, partial [Asimina triloba]